MATYKSSSASQINTFGECEQHWFNASVLKMPVPSTPYTDGGTNVHAELEGYSLEGKQPTHPAALHALRWLAPPRTTNVFIEAWLDPVLELADIQIRGRIDYIDVREPAHPFILDFKSKKKFDRYMKTERTLPKDTQVVIYGAWALSKWPQAEDVTFAHAYLIRDPSAPESLLAEGDEPARLIKTKPLAREVVEGRRDELIPTLERMKAVAAGSITPEKNRSKCDFWYGFECPFKARCFPESALPAGDRLAAMFGGAPVVVPKEGTEMSLMDKLRATKDAPPPATVPLPELFIGAAPAATEPPAAGGTTATVPDAGFELYIDTVPTKGVTEYLRLSDEIHRRSELIASSAGANSLTEKPLDFGKGKDKLCDSFRRFPPTGVVVATSGGLSSSVIEVLEGLPSARKVFRGTR